MRLQEKAIGQFESHLDIRSIVKTRIDLSILIRSLLNKEQRVLFRNQHARAFAQYDSSSEKYHELKSIRQHHEQVDNHLDTDFVQMPRKAEVIKEAFDKILGYEV